MLYVIHILFLIVIYLLFFYDDWSKLNRKQFLIRTMFYIYICIVMIFTLFPFRFPMLYSDRLTSPLMNFIPYRDWKAGYAGAIRETILNIVMFIPFGILLSFMKKVRLIKIIIMSFLFSLSIECGQVIFGWLDMIDVRRFDVTDLINNTTGGIIGFLSYKVFVPFFIQKSPKTNK